MTAKQTILSASLMILLAPIELVASQRYSQIVLPFPSKRPYDFYYNPADNALVLEIKNTTSSELNPLKTYDEALVRRLLVKEMNANSVEVQLVLKDPSIRATVTEFKDPFRIVVDLFNDGFQEHKDPKTGFPFANTQGASELESKSYIPKVIAPTNLENSGQQSFTFQRDQHQYQQPTEKSTLENTEGARRKLLQPMPQEFANPETLAGELKKIPPGRGGAWKSFPPYIYRIQLAPFRAGKSYKDFLSKNAQKAVSSMMAMADYAAKLFDFGHEGRALSAYKHVIHKSPIIFDKHPLHLWRLAEIHMGQGNLTLADGYYQAMVEKHPDHPLARFAQMRRFDIKALGLIKKADATSFKILAQSIEALPPGKDLELRAQLNLRAIYWGQSDKTEELLIQNKYLIPKINANHHRILRDDFDKLEVPWTSFLAATIVLNDQLEPELPWDKETSDFADYYFKNYKGSKVEPYRTNLYDKMVKKFNTLINQLVDKQNHLTAIRLWESLSPALQKMKQSAQTSWSLAQAYRLLGQAPLAYPFYQLAAENLKNGPNKFRSLFWQMVSLNDTLDATRGADSNTAKIEQLRRQLRTASSKMKQSWTGLKPEEKRGLLISMKKPFEDLLLSEALLKEPTDILLETWSLSLTQTKEGSSQDISKLKEAYAPTAEAVRIISKIAEKYDRLNTRNNANKARLLLSKLDPSSFGQDKATELAWAAELIKLADSYRKANQYLDAGRIYALTGSKSQQFEGRAEALYKGGLLLYRAGRRDEALEAFTKASQDGNNLLYSELAKKRLDMINR